MMKFKFVLALWPLLPLGAAAAEPETFVEKTVTVLHMADTHAALEVHPEIFYTADGRSSFRPAGGFALLAGAVKAERAASPGGALLVNVGDKQAREGDCRLPERKGFAGGPFRWSLSN